MQNSVLGLGRAPSRRSHRHALSIYRMTADRRFDHTSAFAHFAGDQREISFFDTALCELGGQPAMRLVVLGHDETTARLFIEPMNNAGPLFAANSG